MSDYEAVKELVSRTGVTFEQARQAYESCGKDMLSAVISLENSADNDRDNKQTFEKENDNMKSSVRKNISENLKKAAAFFKKVREKLCRNTVRVAGKRQCFSMPVIAAIIILLALHCIALPAFVISLIFGIRYIITGPDLAKDFVIGFSRSDASENSQTAQMLKADFCGETDKGLFNN